MQQVLEYQHVPHDVELPSSRQVLLARRNVPDKNLEESSPDHFGASLDMSDAAAETLMAQAQAKSASAGTDTSNASTSVSAAQVRPASMAQSVAADPKLSAANVSTNHEEDGSTNSATAKTIVLDVEEGGIEMPSFIGKNVRNALEAAEAAGLDLDAIGSGVAREQSPQPGSRVPAGTRVLVRFGR